MIGCKLLRFSPIALVLVTGACGGGGGTKTVTVTETITRTVRAPQVVRVYFVRAGRVAPVERTVPSGDAADLVLALMPGPTAAERQAGFTTAVNENEGTNQMSRLGLAQVVYTLTQTEPLKPILLGTHRYSRADFEDQTPAILVESPLPFATVHSPLRVTGTANTFEATFDYDLVDAGGKVIAHHFVTATSGSGIRGTFDFTIPFTVSRSGPGKLVVYELSAKDGSRIHEIDIPLTLAP